MSITRFTINVGGQPRSLFSVIERGDEVTIGLKSPFGVDRAGFADHPTKTPNIQPSAIREHRFSIHPSHESEKGISAIKMTRILANDRKDNSRHYTKVIKNGDKFALIYARRCGQLDRPEFVPTGKFTNMSLGTYDPAAFTLIYSIVVAARGLKFDPTPNPDLAGLNILETDLKNLRIIVLWTFVNIPSRPYFFSVASTTLPDIDFLMEGETADLCRMQFAKHCVEFTAQMYNTTEISDSIKRSLGFFRTGLNDPQSELRRFLDAAKPILSIGLFEIGGKERMLTSIPPYAGWSEAMTFENVPEKLSRFVSALRGKYPQGDDVRYLMSAVYVASEYIQIDLRSPEIVRFLKVPPNVQSFNFDFACRMLALGEMLFNLRSSDAFPELCRRLKEPTKFRSAFYEFGAARILFDQGFQISARKEIKIKREDFDFYATTSDQRINVEVTALTKPTFSVPTVMNALSDKVKQLPKTHPAIIFCLLPDAWVHPPELFKPRLAYVARRFFGKTERINAVVFMAETPVSWGSEKGIVPLGLHPYVNPRARWPLHDTKFLSGRQLTPEEHRAMKGEGPVRDLIGLRDQEFYHWIDHLVP